MFRRQANSGAQSMKTLVVYFSRSGHTRQVAREIASRCGADLEAIREERGRAGLLGYWRSGWPRPEPFTGRSGLIRRAEAGLRGIKRGARSGRQDVDVWRQRRCRY
jgi:hypothetical protein